MADQQLNVEKKNMRKNGLFILFDVRLLGWKHNLLPLVLLFGYLGTLQDYKGYTYK